MKKNLSIEGMNCGHCSNSVQKALSAVPGVSGVNIDLASKTVTLYIDDTVSDAALTAAVTCAGFEVVGIG